MSARPAQAGASRLQTLAMVILVTVLAVVLMQRLERLQVATERLLVRQTLGAIAQAVNREAITRMALGREQDLAGLEGSNPMLLTGHLASPSDRYAGEIERLDAQALAPGNWYFERASGELLYVPQRRGRIERPDGGRGPLRFTLRLAWHDADGNGHFDPGSADRVTGLRLATLTPYRWRAN